MLAILFATDKGTALVFLAGIFILPVLISLFSIIYKLIFLKKRKHYLFRPVLTIACFLLIISIAQWTYQIALEQAINAAKIIHQQCNEDKSCPEMPIGWDINGSTRNKNDLGVWLTYSASYSYNPEKFDIRVYQGPDLGNHISGGVNLPFKVIRYRDG